MGFVEGALRRRTEQLGGTVEPIELDEDRARLLGPTPPHRREGAVAMAAPHIGGNPDRGLEAHGSSHFRKSLRDISVNRQGYSSGKAIRAAGPLLRQARA